MKKLFALLCIAAILFAVCMVDAVLPAILAPLWFFVLLVVVLVCLVVDIGWPIRPFLPVLASRPPPVD